MTRISIPMPWEEREALINLALQERRGAREQASILLRDALIARGALKPRTTTAPPVAG